MTGRIVDSFPQTANLPVGVIRLGLKARIFSGGTPDKSNERYWEGNLPWLGSGEVNQRHITEPTAHITEEAVKNSSTKIFPRGSIAMALAGQGKTKGMVATLGIDAYGNQSLACIAKYDGCSRFLFWWLTSLYREIRGLSSQDTRDGLNQAMLGQLPVPLFDLATQNSVAAFLDRETAGIDQLIEKKQRFLAVLEQKWAATVTLTLTNGLDPNAPRRDSGVSWIGEIPAHWEVLKLGHIGRCANGINISGEAFGSGFPFVSYSDVYKNPELPRAVSGLVQSTPEDRARYALKAGDVLFTRTSETIDEIGFSSVCMQDMPNSVYAGFLIRFRPNKATLTALFSKFLFRNEALRAFFAKEMMIVTRASLSQNLLQRMPIVLPPLPEQERISAHLQVTQNTHVSVAEKTKASIARLREFRSALITAAVMGQIDVATWGKCGEKDRRMDAIEQEMAS